MLDDDAECPDCGGYHAPYRRCNYEDPSDFSPADNESFGLRRSLATGRPI